MKYRGHFWPARMWRWGTRLFRRRFFFITSTVLLTLVALFLAVLLYLFRPGPVNDLIDYAVSELIDTQAAGFSFDRDKTEVSFPRLNGTGSVHLYNVALESPTKEYRLFHIPHIRVDYALFDLPNRPIDRVVIDQGLYAVANLSDKGDWVDAAAIKPIPTSDEPSSFQLPDVILNGAFVRFRAPMVLNEPSASVAAESPYGNPFSFQGTGGHYLSNINASLIQDPNDPDASTLSLDSECPQWGATSISGRINLRGGMSFRAVKRGLLLNEDLVDRLKAELSQHVDRVFAKDSHSENQVDLTADIEIPATGEMKLSARAVFQGSLMYRDFPILLHNVHGVVEFDGTDLKIVDATARRGSAFARVTGALTGVASPNERVAINVEVDGLVLSPDLLRSVVGERTLEGKLHFAEWERHRRQGALITPEPPEIISKIRSMLEPSGIISANVRITEESKSKLGQTTFRLVIADASARFTGETGSTIEMVSDHTRAPDELEVAALRSLNRLSNELPNPVIPVTEPFSGLPLPLHDISGVVIGDIQSGRAPEFRVQGITPDDERAILDKLGLKVAASPRGLAANRVDTTQKLFADITYRDRTPKSTRDDSRMEARISTEGFRIDDDLVALLPLTVRNQIDQFGLRGAVDIERAEISLEPVGPSDIPPRVQVTIAARNLGGRYLLPGAEEPLTFERIKGTLNLDLERQHLAVRDLEAASLGSLLKASQVSVTSQRLTPAITLTADLGQLPINSALFRKLPAQLQTLERMLGSNPAGTISGTLTAEIAPGKRDLRLTVAVRGITLTHESIRPFTLYQADGDFTVEIREEGMEVRIHRLKGVPGVPVSTRIGTGGQSILAIGPDLEDGRPASHITVSGAIFIPGPHAADQRTSMDLHLNGNRVLLSSEIRQALDRATGGTPDNPGTIASIWSSLEPDDPVGGGRTTIGRIDLDGSLALRIPPAPGAGEFEVSYFFDAAMSGGRIKYDVFPVPLEDVAMKATLAPGIIQFSSLTASMEGARIRVPRLSMAEGTLLIDVEADGVPVGSPAIRAALPQGMRAGIEAINPTGTAALDVAMRITPDRMEFDAGVQLEDTSLTFGVAFTGCRGGLDIRGEFARTPDGQTVPLLTKGDLHLEQAMWKKVKLESLTSALQFSHGRLVLPNLRGRVHGGVFEGNLTLDMKPEGTRYNGVMSARAIQLESLATAIAGGQSDDPGERMVGGVDAELAFFSPDATGIIGRGRVDVGRVPLSPEELENLDSLSEEQRLGKPAELGAVPLFGGIYRELKLTSGEYFNEAALVFHLHPDHIEVRQMNLISDAIRIETVGQNRIYYDKPKRGDQINLEFVPTLFPRAFTLPVAQVALDAFKGVVLRIFVGGTLDAPEVRPLSNRRRVDEDARELPEPGRSKLDG